MCLKRKCILKTWQRTFLHMSSSMAMNISIAMRKMGNTKAHCLMLVKLRLYEGENYSILCASLELLNLQIMFWWSNASVHELLK
eukprot:c4195_g1_i1 orf=63-314(+)